MAIATTATASSSHINRAVISLDGILVGNVSEEENNNMIVTHNRISHHCIYTMMRQPQANLK
jgi:hypothetical protein